MTFAEVKYLTEKGFSHDEIISIMNGAPITTPAPEPVHAAPAPPEPAPAPVPEPVPVPVVVAPEPVPAAPAQDSNAAVTQLSQDVRSLIQTIQAANILNSRNTVPKEYTAQMAMAEILNPRTDEPIGGKEK